MEFVTVDNNQSRLTQLGALLKSVFPDCTVTPFSDPLLSAKYVLNHQVDAVLVEKVMRPADGEMLKKVILTNKPDVKVALLTDPGGMSEPVLKDKWLRPIQREQLQSICGI